MNCFNQVFTHIAYLIGLRFRSSIYKNRSKQTESSDSQRENNEQRENEDGNKFTYDLRTEERKGLLKGESSDDDWSSVHTKQQTKQDRLRYTIEIKGENNKQQPKEDAYNHAVGISSDSKGQLIEVNLDDDLVSNVDAPNHDTDSLIVEIDVEETSKKCIAEDILVYVDDGEGPLENGNQENYIAITSSHSHQVETPEVEISKNGLVEVDATHELIVGDIPSYHLEVDATPIALDPCHQENDKVTDESILEDHQKTSPVGNVLEYQTTADSFMLNFQNEVERVQAETPEVDNSKNILVEAGDTHGHIEVDIPSYHLEVEAAPIALDHENQEDDKVPDESILADDHEESSVGNVSEYQVTVDPLMLNFKEEESGQAETLEVDISKNVYVEVDDTHELIVGDIPSYLEVEATPIVLDHENQEDDEVDDESILSVDHGKSSVENVSEYQITADPLVLNFHEKVESAGSIFEAEQHGDHKMEDISVKEEYGDEQPIGNLRADLFDFTGYDKEERIVEANVELQRNPNGAEYPLEEHDSETQKVLPEPDKETGDVSVVSSTEFSYETHVEIQEIENEGRIIPEDDLSKEVTITKCMDFMEDNIMGEDDKVVSTEEITFEAPFEIGREIHEISEEKLDEDVCALQDVSGNDESVEDGNLLILDTNLEILSDIQDEERTTNEDIFQKELPKSDPYTNILDFSGNILMTENATVAPSEEDSNEAHLCMQHNNENTIDDPKADDHLSNEGTHMESRNFYGDILMADNDNELVSKEDTLGFHIGIEDSNSLNENTSSDNLLAGDVSFGFDTDMVGEMKSCDEDAREYEIEIKNEDSHMGEDSSEDLKDESEKENYDKISLQYMSGDHTITLLDKESCQELNIRKESETTSNLTSSIEVEYGDEIEKEESENVAQIVDVCFNEEEEEDSELDTSEALPAYSLEIEGDTNVSEKESVTFFDEFIEKENKEGYVCDESFEEEKYWKETGDNTDAESGQMSIVDTSIDIQLSSSHVEF